MEGIGGVAATIPLSARQVLAVLAIGLVIGYGAFLVTGQESDTLLLPPECRLSVAAGFDPITGLPHGSTVECAQLTGSGGQLPVAQVNPMTSDLASRRQAARSKRSDASRRPALGPG